MLRRAVFNVVLDQRVRQAHGPRPIRRLTSAGLKSLPDRFAKLYSGLGRPSIAPKILRPALLLQAPYSNLSDRQLLECPEFDLLPARFVDFGVGNARDSGSTDLASDDGNFFDTILS